jgi:hypothetical protein
VSSVPLETSGVLHFIVPRSESNATA